MFDAKGELVWASDHHVWGAVRTVRTHGALALKPSHDPQPAELHCPFRFPGQYEDQETGLYYNRHRHYDPLTGQYASPDPIGLAGGDRPQGYVSNPAVWVDPLGLAAAVVPSITQRLTSHLDDAVKDVQASGLTPNQNAALQRLKDRGQDPQWLQRIFVGERIDAAWRVRVAADPALAGVKVTPRGQFGPDAYIPGASGTPGQWWDVTTPGAWQSHVSKYGSFGQGTLLPY